MRDSPHKTVAELTAAMKAKGDKATYATGAPAGTIMGELYKAATGVQAIEVVYKHGGGFAERIAERQARLRHARPRVRARATARKALAHSAVVEHGAKARGRSRSFRRQRSRGSTGPHALVGGDVPAGTPKPIVEQINKWFVEIVGTEETKKFLGGFGGDPNIIPQAQAQKNFLDDIERWKEYIRVAKIQPQ